MILGQDLEEDKKPEFIVFTPISKIKIAIALFSLLASCFLAWYYYEYKYLPKQEIQTITSEYNIVRIKPDKPGGALVPNTDKLVYNNLKPGKNIEHSISIMPDPEEPMKIVQKDNIDGDNNKIDDIILNIISGDDKKKVSENSSESDVVTSIHSNQDVSENILAREENNIKTLNIVPVEGDRKHNNKKNQTSTKTYYRLQLASVRTEASAIKEWSRLKKLYPKQLESLPYKVEKVSVENKGLFYRLLVGKFSNFSKAKAVCKKMSYKYQTCTIIHN